jgi:hypothetical protein
VAKKINSTLAWNPEYMVTLENGEKISMWFPEIERGCAPGVV